MELQDIVLENSDVRVQIQFKLASKIWPPSKVREVVAHLVCHRVEKSDFLVFVSDHAFHDSLAILQTAARTLNQLEETLVTLYKERKESVAPKIQSSDLQRVFLHQFSDAASLTFSLKQALRPYIATSPGTLERVLRHFRKLSIRKGGSSMNRQELFSFFYPLYSISGSPPMPRRDWMLQGTRLFEHNK